MRRAWLVGPGVMRGVVDERICRGSSRRRPRMLGPLARRAGYCSSHGTTPFQSPPAGSTIVAFQDHSPDRYVGIDHHTKMYTSMVMFWRHGALMRCVIAWCRIVLRRCTARRRRWCRNRTDSSDDARAATKQCPRAAAAVCARRPCVMGASRTRALPREMSRGCHDDPSRYDALARAGGRGGITCELRKLEGRGEMAREL